MKVISLPEIASRIRYRRSGKTFLAEFINQCKIDDAIIIPEGATNGDVFMPMFPDLKIEDNIGSIYMHDDNGISLIIDKKWLNAPYKKGRKNRICRKN